MGNLLTPDALSLFLLFSVPGVIALYFRAQFLTGKLPTISDGALSYVTLSLAYHAVTFRLFRPLYSTGQSESWQGLVWFLVIFVIPAITGILLGLNVRKGWTKRLVNRVGINTIHPVDSAWDWKFGNCSECWVIVTLKNDTMWYGYLGSKSFMSSSLAERDILIEGVYDFHGNGRQWTARNSSVWIAHGEIQSIEFLAA